MKHTFQNCELFQNQSTIIDKCDPNLTQHKHVYAICCRTEVTSGVISGENVKTAEGYANFQTASISRFRENQNHPFA